MPAGHPGCIFMHIYACIYAYSCIFMHIYAYLCRYLYVFMHIHAYLCMYLCVFIHIHPYLCVFYACFMHMYAYSCVFMHIYVYLYVCLIQGKYIISIYSEYKLMHHWTQFDLFINHYRNNQHIFRCCTGMTPWHGGGLGAVRL